MKSFLKFLSRNKLYTAIQAVGLVVSLAFVIIVSCFVWQQFAVTREATDYNRIYALNMGQDWLSAFPGEMSLVQGRIPEIEAAGRLKCYTRSVTFNGQPAPGNPDIYVIDPVIFDIIPQKFLKGSAEVLKDKGQVLLGESFARKISPGENPVGRPIVIGKDTCIIGGIIKAQEKSLLKETDIYRSFDGPDLPLTTEFVTPIDLVLLSFREGADIEAARTLIDTLVVREFPDTFSFLKPEYRMTIPFKELYFSDRGKLSSSVIRHGDVILVYVLIAVGILLLMSALFNYINLSVALAGKRAKEMAIRKVLGETKTRIILRYVSESIVFVAVCMAFALMLAKGLEPVFNRYVAGDIGLEVTLSSPYLTFYTLLVILVGLISGLVPAMITSRYNPVAVIKGEQRRQTKRLFSKVFIVVQNVISVALISLALVMEMQYNHLLTMPLGADVSNLYYISSGSVGKDELAAKPYVERMGVSNAYPGGIRTIITTYKDERKIEIRALECDRDAFDLFGFEVVKDFRVPGEGLWLTESAARFYSFDESRPSPISLMVWPDLEVCGIIKDFVTNSPSEAAGNQIGIVKVSPIEGQSTYVLKLNRFDAEVRSELREIARQESIRLTGGEEYGEKWYGYIPELIERGMQDTRRFISLIELFMVVAILIALLGLVAISAYYTGLETRDIAVRKVFGGTIASEARRTVTEYMVLIGIAIMIGIPVAIFLAERYLRQFWYRIENYGWVLAVAAAIALSVSFLSVLWQTIHASSTNPAEELKKE